MAFVKLSKGILLENRVLHKPFQSLFKKYGYRKFSGEFKADDFKSKVKELGLLFRHDRETQYAAAGVGIFFTSSLLVILTHHTTHN